ncbi:TlpA family protein disulfide reductase [Halomonas garicola]|uniref:TlpA family protein disulfide reductase n=1 Tax=Halomonas garicola TaxID=1690008 RepID=UPI002898B364|nr:TlpA disulfide reductase family protein [Halomonas garicola]
MNAVALGPILMPLPCLYALAAALALLAGVLGYALRCAEAKPGGRWQGLAHTALLTLSAGGLGLVFAALLPPATHSGPTTLPDITLEDLDGNAVALAELPGAAGPERDTPIIVHLWATGCPPCRRDMALLAELGGRRDVRVASINQGEDLLPAVRYLDNTTPGAPAFDIVLRDPQQRLMAAFDATRLPLTLLLDARGRVQKRRAGELNQATLARWLGR